MGTESESMLQLAAEAFQAENFDLAADIYECQLGALPGNAASRRLALMVKLADALAFGGKLTEAFGVYRQASEIERLGPEHLGKLVEYLTERVRRREGRESNTRPNNDYGTGSGCADFSCRICLSFLCEPVTLTCGHCFCKKCLEREKPQSCRECGSSSIKLTDALNGYRVNVVLSSLLTKWFPLQAHAVRLRRQGNGLYADRKMEAALEKYNQAILIAPRDHILFSNRSQIHSSLRHYDQALRDAETTCTLMPQWSTGHVRKAQALVSLGRSEEALREYLISLSIEPSRLARSEAYKLLSDLLTPLTHHVPERVLDYSSLLSSRMHIKNNMAAHTACLPSTRVQHKALHTASPYTTAPLKSSQSLNTSKSSSEFNLLASPPALKHQEVRDQGEAQAGWLERGFLPKRKRKSGEEEDGGEKNDGCKRSKLESAEVCGSQSSVVADLIDPTDLECSLCMRLFYEPVTTPCGHTFCLQCLERCLDHNPKCPLCKEELSEYLAQRQYFKTVLMENLIAKYVPSEMMDRQKINLEELAELSNLNKNVPIFVCTMAFPTVPCPLHIFEPCYRLMIRRCMETGTKCFGMCLGDDLKGFASYGCLLEIRDVELFSDGRSVVDTIGRRRFKVIQHHQRDGYNTADIEYLEDIKVDGVAEQELQSLHDAVYDQALIWVNSLKKEQKERIVGHFGPMPEKDSKPQTSPNGPSWCWWLLAVLPLEGRAQLPFLALTSLKDRLCGIRRVLLFMACSKHR